MKKKIICYDDQLDTTVRSLYLGLVRSGEESPSSMPFLLLSLDCGGCCCAWSVVVAASAIVVAALVAVIVVEEAVAVIVEVEVEVEVAAAVGSILFFPAF